MRGGSKRSMENYLKKLLAESVLDNAASGTCSEETAEACGTASGGGHGNRAARVQSAARVQAAGDRPFDPALSV